MKIIFSYDTEDKSLSCICDDGTMINDVGQVSLSKFGENTYDCSVMKKSAMANGMSKTEMWQCYASKQDKAVDLKDFFKKS